MAALRRLQVLCCRLAVRRRCLCTQQVSVSITDDRVQELLFEMTGMDMDKVFAARREPLTQPVYKLMNQQQLKKAHAEVIQMARELLRMPPDLPERSPQGKVLEKDQRLEGYIDCKMVFTDISEHMENKDRRIVVREPSGDLREATWGERDRMCQVYFPALGRKMWLPEMLSPQNLPILLQMNRHLHVLDTVCVQCEPDSTDNIRVHHTVYEDVDSRSLYDLLRSTRHFGGLVWYLVGRQCLGGLLRDLLERQLYSDMEHLMKLYLLCYPESEFARGVDGDSDGMQLVEVYCRHYGLSELINLLPTYSGSESNENLTANNS